MVPIFSQKIALHTLPYSFLSMRFNSIIQSTTRCSNDLFPSEFPIKPFVCIAVLSHTSHLLNNLEGRSFVYRGADKSLARPGRKQAWKHVRDARDLNNIETRAVIKVFFFLQVKAPKEIHAILTETLACFLPGRAKDLSAPCILIFIRTL